MRFIKAGGLGWLNLVLAAVVFLGWLFPMEAFGQSAEARKLLDEGIELAHKGKYDEAIAVYKKVIELVPKWEAPYYDMGISYQNKKDLKTARQLYEKAVALAPNYGTAWNRLGGVCSDLNDLLTAEAAYKKAIRFMPGNREPYWNLSLAYCQQKNYRAAREALVQAKTLPKGTPLEKIEHNLKVIDKILAKEKTAGN